MKISTNVFLTLTGLTAFILLLTLVLVRWSFQQGFLDFIADLEQKRMRFLAESILADYHANGNSWEFLQGQPLESRGPPSRFREQGRRPPPDMPRHPEHVGRQDSPPTALYSDDGALIGGVPWQGEVRHQFSYAIYNKGNLIAELRSWPSPVSTNSVANDFIAKQFNQSILIGLSCLILAMIAAWMLTTQLTRPIRLIHDKVVTLTKGEYKVEKSHNGNNEMGQLMQNVEQLADTLDKTREAKNQWFAAVSHELRTPLTVLKGELEALDAGIRPFNQASLISLNQEVALLEHLINDLYQLSLSDMGALKYQFSDTNVSEILIQSCASVAQQYFDKYICLHKNIETTISFEADANRLFQLFLNLLNNALLYTDGPGDVYVSLKRQKEAIHLTIEDTAPTVAKDDYDQLFEPLFRGNRARTRQGSGAGLGLAICKNIVEAHQGTITARPSNFGGIAILVIFPLKKVY